MKTTVPATSAEWGQQITRLEADVQRAEAEIAGAKAQREKLAVDEAAGVAGAAKEHERAFAAKAQLEANLEKLNGRLQYARREMARTKAAEDAERERVRLTALADATERKLRLARRGDALMRELAQVLTDYAAASSEAVRYGSRDHRRVDAVATMAAKEAGLREHLRLASPLQGQSMEDHVQAFDRSYQGNNERVA